MLCQIPKYFFAANLKHLKIRMKTVTAIGKITRAMKMVAAAKMRQDQTRLEGGKNFALGSV